MWEVGTAQGGFPQAAGTGHKPQATNHKLQATGHKLPTAFPRFPASRPACRPRPGAHAANDADARATRNGANHELQATAHEPIFKTPTPALPKGEGAFAFPQQSRRPGPAFGQGPGPGVRRGDERGGDGGAA
ncbi:hypothetical protein ODE01S_14530 [Oceanithermus desulfurans NBRC 100063]|uniref:Uncharacterized protein n=1 Tax=Oceanithermus desulfurans NBRC 100063 TaxID=1227550 RepID=A0A511RK41_9DEIN|nr:hypothetical protein ODE01S_14530 [Oceanithermus desulfurans NBRC 100063]